MKRYLAYILGFAIFVYLVINMDFKGLLIFARTISLKIVLLLLSLQIMTIMLLGIQWKLIISWIRKDIRFYDALKINLKGNIVDALSPGVKVGGELARVYEIKNALNMEMGEAILVVGLQKTLSITSFIFLVIFSLIWLYITTAGNNLYFRAFLVPILVFLIILMGFIFFFLRIDLERTKKVLKKIRIKDAKKEKIYNWVSQYRNNLNKMLENKGKFYFQLLLGISIWLLFAVKLAILIRGYNISIDFISAAAITYLTYIIGMLPLLPGGIGSFETSMVGLLALKGIEVGNGIAISVVFRFVTFWFEFLMSFLILFFDKVFKLLTIRNDINMLKVQIKEDKKYFLPSLITYTNMLFGIIAIWLSSTREVKNIKVSCILVILAAIVDKIDGLVARKFNLTSSFGRELDSLCDLLSFGLAPVVIWWNLNGGYLKMLELVISILFVGAGIFRLARFNIDEDYEYIKGLPITLAGSFFAIKHLIDINYRIQSNIPLFNENVIILTLLSVFMVSRFRIKRPSI
ncbi:flippase-like domain-containing protein [Tepidimicrobium xylanilyticum]|uniref:Phosphatidylglycerol lysyltransferase n=1 Tax=Tepidimicrobium xylanilyticum TaxID=1123352 RepID=A0A1H2QH40_9FIRM|nr:flippase-like domain-containing protein [Tepidimicrobium xylanilyticum]GMG95673.1 hypothetical protein EN5CB1_04990 [Tepidimicrobium xylanilyticum]SDW05759.1 CDP-diacylglycerol--serine O-phosphatidyltransferase [Tepidimicrobium xylanilyticum]